MRKDKAERIAGEIKKIIRENYKKYEGLNYKEIEEKIKEMLKGGL